MSRLIKVFSDGSRLEYDRGKFDAWCVYLIANNQRTAPRDKEYFADLQNLSQIYAPQQIYDDFIEIYNETDSTIKPEVLQQIEQLSLKYHDDALEIEQLFTILYAGMVAEENKENAILKKRIKRLGIYQVLIEGLSPCEAANFSKGKKWSNLNSECKLRGF